MVCGCGVSGILSISSVQTTGTLPGFKLQTACFVLFYAAAEISTLYLCIPAATRQPAFVNCLSL